MFGFNRIRSKTLKVDLEENITLSVFISSFQRERSTTMKDFVNMEKFDRKRKNF